MDGLKDLFTSPEVYWKSDSGFVSVNTETRVFERKKAEDGKIFNVTINMTVDNSDERQW